MTKVRVTTLVATSLFTMSVAVGCGSSTSTSRSTGDSTQHPVTSTTVAVSTTLISGDYTTTPDFGTLVRRSALVGEFRVVAVERGAVYRDFHDERDQLAVATLRPVTMIAGSPGSPTVKVAVGSWVSDPNDPTRPEVLRTTGWTFAVGDRVIAGLKRSRFPGVYGWSAQDAYFVLDGSALDPELAHTRARIRTPSGVRTLTAEMTAADLRQALRQAAGDDPDHEPGG